MTGEERNNLINALGNIETCQTWEAEAIGDAISELEQAKNLYEVGYENGRREEHDRVLKILHEHFKGV